MDRKIKAPSKSVSLIIVVLFLCSIIISLFPNLTVGQSTDLGSSQEDQIQSMLQSSLKDLDFTNNTMYVGIWVIHIYNYQYTTGTYTLDMYVYFFWTDPNITTVDWYLTNGYPINSGAKILVASNTTNEIKYENYRITATLNNPPNAKEYPFDHIQLKISLELLTMGNAVNLSWAKNQTGIDNKFINPNFKTTNIDLSTAKQSYPLGREPPYAEMSITQAKIKPSSAIASLFPPLIFCVVSAISFLFSLKDPASVGLRMGLNTSMLITTILFQISISASIPPSTSISVFGLFMISVLLFLALNLVVTIIGFAHFVKFKNEKFTLRLNRWGFIISLIIPILLFIILYSLRA